MEATGTERKRRAGRTLQVIVLVVLFGVLVAAVAGEWANARRVLGTADWRLLLPALAVTALSFVCSSSAYALACRSFGVAARTARLVLAGFVTMAVNNLITLGGAGYAVGTVLLTARDMTELSGNSDRVPSRIRDIAAASAFNAYLYFAVGTTCLPLSLLYVVVDRQLPQRAEAGIVLVVVLACLFAVLVNLAVFLPRFRAAMLRFLGRLVPRSLGHSIPGSLAAFDDSFTRGLTLLRSHRGRLLGLLACIVGDWLFCIAAIWFCFAALGIRLHAGVMLSGFFIAIAAGALSMLPGGMGVQDGSMAGVYALLGVSWASPSARPCSQPCSSGSSTTLFLLRSAWLSTHASCGLPRALRARSNPSAQPDSQSHCTSRVAGPLRNPHASPSANRLENRWRIHLHSHPANDEAMDRRKRVANLRPNRPQRRSRDRPENGPQSLHPNRLGHRCPSHPGNRSGNGSQGDTQTHDLRDAVRT
jgi:glycosyltransferase 2 family protein